MVQFNRSHLSDLCRSNGIARLRIFGSAARREDRPDSHVDLIAEFDPPVGFFELIRAETGLAEFFGRPVDLLTEGAISRHMRDTVLDQAEVIFDAGD